MNRSKDGSLTKLLIAILLLALASCGDTKSLLSDLASLNASEDFANTAQGEIQSVIQSAQTAILAGIIRDKSLSIGNCKPQFGFGFRGVNLAFQRTDTCNLEGNVSLLFFPAHRPSGSGRLWHEICRIDEL